MKSPGGRRFSASFTPHTKPKKGAQAGSPPSTYLSSPTPTTEETAAHRHGAGGQDRKARGRRRRHAAHEREHPQIRRQRRQHRRGGAGSRMNRRPNTPAPPPPRRQRRPHTSQPYLQPDDTDPGLPHPSPAAADEGGEGNHRRCRGNRGNSTISLSLASLYCRRGRGRR